MACNDVWGLIIISAVIILVSLLIIWVVISYIVYLFDKYKKHRVSSFIEWQIDYFKHWAE